MNVALAPPAPSLDSLADHAAHEERLGRWDSAAQTFSRLFRTALGMGEVVRAVNALRGQARVRREQGRLEEAGELAELSQVVAERHGLALEAARAMNVVGIIRFAEGEHAAAAELYEKALDLAIEVGDDDLVGYVCQNLGALLYEQDRMREARIRYLESIGASVRSGNKRSELMAYNNLGVACTEMREWIEAELYFARGIEIAERIGDSVIIASLLANRARPLIHIGELGRALESLSRAEAAARAIDSQITLADIARFRGIVALKSGNNQDARRFLDESLAIATSAGLQLERAEALMELGSLYMEVNQPAEAESVLRSAADYFQQAGPQRDIRRVRDLLQTLQARTG